MKDALISVIIPVYNVEKFIRECLDSVLASTYSNLEVILVDDGSKDRSGSICDEYAQNDKRIQVIHQKNMGLSAARNTGMDAAKGEYIFFLDSDDSIRTDYIGKLFDVLNDSDANFAFSDIESTKLADTDNIFAEKITMNKADVEEWLTKPSSREYVLMVVAWNKLYKASLLKNIRFSVGKLHEDEFFINHILHSVKNAVFIPYKGYIYRDNVQGITGDSNKTNVRHLDVIDAYAERIRFAIEDNELWFAKRTLTNALYKAFAYSKSDLALCEPARKKLKGLMNEFGKYMTIKQKLKYQVLLIKHKLPKEDK